MFVIPFDSKTRIPFICRDKYKQRDVSLKNIESNIWKVKWIYSGAEELKLCD